jgi:hypothetical protein
MSKRQANARVDSSVDNDIRRYQQQEGIESRSVAIRNLLRRGIRDYNSPGLLTQLLREAAKLTLIAAAMAVSISAAFRFNPRLIAIGGAFAVMSLACGSAYAVSSPHLSLPVTLTRQSVATDGGERE